MKYADKPQEQPPRTERRGEAPGPRSDQAQRFRATARQIATQLDIEAAMWRMLDQEAER